VYLHLQIIKSCLILTSLCMLFEVDPIYLHYMTDRHKRFDLKISKLKILWKQRHLHLGTIPLRNKAGLILNSSWLYFLQNQSILVMIDFQMAAIKVTGSVCQSMSVNLDCAQTGVWGETQNQPAYSTPFHRVNTQRSILLSAEIVASTSNRRQESRTLAVSLNGGTWCPLHVPLATTSKLHPNHTLPILITERRNHNKPISNIVLCFV